MSPRARLWVKRAALTITTLAVLVTATIAWLISTVSGARWGFERIDAFLPGTLRVEYVTGRLSGPLEVRRLRYESDRIQISIERLAIDWSLRALALRRLDVRTLDADSVRIVHLTPKEAAAAEDTLKPELPDLDLPMDVMIRKARVTGLFVTGAEAESAFVVERIDLTSGSFRDTLGIGLLVMQMPRGRLELEGRARPNGRYAVDLRARWSFRTEGDRLWSGDGRLVGSLDTVRVIQDVRSPFQAHIEGLAFEPLRHPRFDAVIDFSRMDPRVFGDSYPAAVASGRMTVAGTPDTFDTRGSVDAITRSWGHVMGSYRFSRAPEQVRFQEIVVTQPGRPSRIVAQGRIATVGESPAMQFQGRWTRLEFPLTGTPHAFSPTGAFRIAGTTDRYRLSSEAMLGVKWVPPTPVKVAGTGTPRVIDLNTISGALLGGNVAGRGRVTLDAPLGWNLTFTARDLDPSTVWQAYPGSFGFEARTRGDARDGGPVGVVTIENLSGQVREEPVSGRLDLDLVPGGNSVRNLAVLWGTNELTASGLLADRWDLDWTLNAPDLSVIPHGAGRMIAQGHFGGSEAGPHITASLEADSIRWKHDGAHRVTLDADIDLGGGRVGKLDAEAAGLHVASRSLLHAGVHGSGWRDAHEVTLTARNGSDSIRTAVRGGLLDGEWRGDLTQMDLVSQDFGSWSLDSSAAALAASREAASMRGFSWKSGASRVDLDATWRKGNTWTLNSILESIRLAVLQPFMPPAVTIEGTFAGAVHARGTGSQVAGDAQIDLGQGELRYPVGKKKTGTTTIEPSTIRAFADGRSVSGEAALSFGAAGTVSGHVRMPQRSGGDALDGALKVALTDLGVAQVVLPELTATRGRLDADLRLSGTRSRPQWSGQAALSEGAADVPRYGLELRDAQFKVQGQGGSLAFDGGMRSGPGTLQVKGDAQLTPGVARAQATLTGSRFQASKTQSLNVLVSPQLHITMVGDSARLTGEVLIPEADIRNQERQREAIGSSKDVVYVGADSGAFEKRAAFVMSSSVRLVLGELVRIRAAGLDARPTGSVLAIDKPGSPMSGSGELNLTGGTYKAYGQDLRIERGRLFFAGGLIANPGLDFRASRLARDGVVAGFEVTGTLETPRFALFSDPPMAERDALAYVVLGHKLNDKSESESGIVTSAAQSLGLSGGNLIASSVASRFGIDEASIETEGTLEQAQLMLGTYLSPRVYVNYGIGVIDPVSLLRIQYFLNSKWTLHAETGSQSSAEVLYTIER